MGISNFVCFLPVQIFSIQRQWFCLSGRVVGSGVFVRRSVTYGYGGYCLSGKGERSGKLKVEVGEKK